MAENRTPLKPGTPAPTSGFYDRTGDGMQVALSEGDRIPPGRPGRNDRWVLTRPTRQPKRR